MREFLQPFSSAGTVDIFPASTCARVVASGGCAAPLPRRRRTPCRRSIRRRPASTAIDAGLVVHRAHPLNCETSIPALIGGVVMPNARFYVRNHFQIPDARSRRPGGSQVGGLVERPLQLTSARPADMRSQTHRSPRSSAPATAARCSTRRSRASSGTSGAVSTAEWTGVPLVEVLDRAGRQPRRPRGACSAAPMAEQSRGRPSRSAFERSLSRRRRPRRRRAAGLRDERRAAAVQHGYPLRLIVPGWYAVASVKWLTEIEVIDRAVRRLLPDRPVLSTSGSGTATIVSEPVRLQRVRALITEPTPATSVAARRPRRPRRRVVGRGADRPRRRERRRRPVAGGAARSASAIATAGSGGS